MKVEILIKHADNINKRRVGKFEDGSLRPSIGEAMAKFPYLVHLRLDIICRNIWQYTSKLKALLNRTSKSNWLPMSKPNEHPWPEDLLICVQIKHMSMVKILGCVRPN